MALSKVTYVDGVTIIGAKNLNDIQDELIRQGEQQTEDEESMETALALKADKETTYTKTEVDTALALKADKSDTFTKAEVNSALALKADKSDTYTKTEVNEALELKADKSDTYTKTQVDEMVQEAVEEAVKESEYSNFEMKSVSGDFVHITDGAGLIPVKDLKIGIDAVQDLHGYDAPWVGGAGKNILPLEVDIIKSQNTDGTWNGNAYSLNGVTFTILVDSDGNVIGINVNGTASDATIFVVNNSFRDKLAENTEYMLSGSPTNPDVTKWKLRLYMSADWIDAGNGRTFEFIPLAADCKVEIVVYSGTAMSNVLFKPMICLSSASNPLVFVPYANICPISGWTGAKVSVNGINQWDEEWERSLINASGVKVANSAYIASKNAIRVEPSTSYCFLYAQQASSTSVYVAWYDANGTFISRESQGVSTSGVIFTSPINADSMEFCIGSALYPITAYNNNISINYPSTDTDYHAYDGHVYSVTWEDEAGTVYGGTLDVTTGELVVTHGYVDLGTLTWNYNTNAQAFVNSSIPDKPNGGTDYICSAYPFGASVSSTSSIASGIDKAIYTQTSNKNFFIKDSAFGTDTASFKTAMDGVQLVYELATPQTYQLTPTEVLTLLGENNIFADTGAIEELIYRISRQ